MASELQQTLGLILGSSVVSGGILKLVEFGLAEWKARQEAKRVAALPPKESLSPATRAAGLITPLIYHLLAEYEKDGNVTIAELHNGDHFYSGRGIQRITMTAEACLVRGQGRIADMQNMILNSDQLNWIEDLRTRKQAVYYPETQQIDPGFIRDYFDYYEIRSAYIVGLFNTHGQLFGLLTISSQKPDFLAGQPKTGILQQVQHLQNHLTIDPA